MSFFPIYIRVRGIYIYSGVEHSKKKTFHIFQLTEYNIDKCVFLLSIILFLRSVNIMCTYDAKVCGK